MARPMGVVVATIIIGLIVVSLHLFHRRQLKMMHQADLSLNIRPGISTRHPAYDEWKELKRLWNRSSDAGAVHALTTSFTMIVVSELGDKTFFIAAILAMRSSRSTVYVGATGALVVMTVLSALLGSVATALVPPLYTQCISGLLFAAFGVKMLFDGYGMSRDDVCEEMNEAEKDIRKNMGVQFDLDTGRVLYHRQVRWDYFIPVVMAQAFVMTFLAEWGDRSQLATIVLAARERRKRLWNVVIGSCLGHALCTALAVLGGKAMADKISVRTVTLIGGVTFLIFAVSSILLALPSRHDWM